MDLIIGGGVTGLSYAAFTRNDYRVMEAADEIGGYCKTIRRNGFTWDYSGHFFHFQNQAIKKWLIDNVQDELLDVEKITHISYKDRWIDFPFQKNIHQLDQQDFTDCLYDLVHKEDIDIKSFKDFVVSRFGKSIADLFLIPYNEKLYAIDLDKLDKDAMGRFFPDANLKDIISNFRQSDATSYNQTFTYPRGGAIEYIRAIERRVDSEKLELNKRVVSIDMKGKRATFSDGEVVEYDNLINTMPLPKLLDLCGVNYEKEKFTANKVAVFNLGFDRPSKQNSHWIYFPQKELSFYRIGFYNNIFGDNRMSLYVEMGLPEDADIDQQALLEQALADLEKVGVIDGHELVDHEFLVMSPAYVHISKDSEEQKARVMAELAKHDIYSAGRYGNWTYCSIEDNIIEALNLSLRLEETSDIELKRPALQAI